MKKIVGISIVILAILASCSDEEKGKPVKPQVYPSHNNSHMAKIITGTNERWGEFKFIVNYEKINLLDDSYRVTPEIDTVGHFKVSRSKEFATNTFEVTELINKVSPDSVLRLDAALAAKHGAGNYSLQDSIPQVSRTILKTQVYYYSDGRTYKQVDSYHSPEEDMGTTDEEFDNTYYLRKSVTNYYEYNNDGYIIVNRTQENTYSDIKNPEVFDQKVFKYVIDYDKDKIVSFTKSELSAGDNYTEVETYTYSYANGKLASIVGNKGYRKTFEYSGNNLRITEGSNVSNYQLTSFGYPSRIEDGKGGVLNVEYIEGDGELDSFTSFTDKLFGNPYIR